MPAKRTAKATRNGTAAQAASPPPSSTTNAEASKAPVEDPKKSYVVGDVVMLGPDDQKTLEAAADPVAAAHAMYGRFLDHYETAMASLDMQKRKLRGDVLAAKTNYEAAIRAVGGKYGVNIGPDSQEAWAYDGHGILKRTG